MNFKSVLIISILLVCVSVKCAQEKVASEPKPSSLETDFAKCLFLSALQDSIAKDFEDGNVTDENKKAFEDASKANDLNEAQRSFLATTPKSFASRSRSPLITDAMKEKARHWDSFLKTLGDDLRWLGTFKEFIESKVPKEFKAAILDGFCAYTSLLESPVFVALGSQVSAACPSPVNLSKD